MSDFLEQVVAERRADAAAARAARPVAPLTTDTVVAPGADPFAHALRASHHVGVIAEVKRVSPALGRLASDSFDVVAQARRYVDAGASAISVLTEPRHWGGSLDDLAAIRAAVGPRVPILCKDVVVDESQIVAAKEAGATAVLLIAEALTDEEIRGFSVRATTLTLGVLLEAHEPEAFGRAVRLGSVVGVNARDLRHPSDIDTRRIHDLAPLARPHQILVAESGIASADDVRALPARVDAVLVGTALMRAPDPADLIAAITAIERVAV